MSVSNSLTEPVMEVPPDALAAHEESGGPPDSIGLCLSGGGFRAMLFHVGAAIRLNELGLLSKLGRVASVSGGSITAGILALNWNKLKWTADGSSVEYHSLASQFIEPLRAVARTNIDIPAIGWGSFNPFKSISDEVVSAYDKVAFHKATLQDLPTENEDSIPKTPRFVFTATNVKTGTLWRFAKPYMADYKIGIVDSPDVPLAVAVAASSAFPPFLSPLRMNLDRFIFRPGIPAGEVSRSLRSEAVLTDGGVYDNLGLEAVWKRYKTVLISDGGRPSDDDLQPTDDWARHSRRLIDLLQRQVSSLRIRQVMKAFHGTDDPHIGAYWGIGTDATKYPTSKTLQCSFAETWAIAEIETRLTALSETDQERIMNWGYASCDFSVRSYFEQFKAAQPAAQFPYPATGLRG